MPLRRALAAAATPSATNTDASVYGAGGSSAPLLYDNSVVTAVKFPALLELFGFLACIWAAGQASNRLKINTLVGEILAGALLGPPLAEYQRYPRYG